MVTTELTVEEFELIKANRTKTEADKTKITHTGVVTKSLFSVSGFVSLYANELYTTEDKNKVINSWAEMVAAGSKCYLIYTQDRPGCSSSYWETENKIRVNAKYVTDIKEFVESSEPVVSNVVIIGSMWQMNGKPEVYKVVSIQNDNAKLVRTDVKSNNFITKPGETINMLLNNDLPRFPYDGLNGWSLVNSKTDNKTTISNTSLDIAPITDVTKEIEESNDPNFVLPGSTWYFGDNTDVYYIVTTITSGSFKLYEAILKPSLGSYKTLTMSLTSKQTVVFPYNSKSKAGWKKAIVPKLEISSTKEESIDPNVVTLGSKWYSCNLGVIYEVIAISYRRDSFEAVLESSSFPYVKVTMLLTKTKTPLFLGIWTRYENSVAVKDSAVVKNIKQPTEPKLKKKTHSALCKKKSCKHCLDADQVAEKMKELSYEGNQYT